MRIRDIAFSRFAAQRLRRALTRSRVRVSNPAFVHLVGVAGRAKDDADIGALVSGQPLFLRYEKAFSWPAGSEQRLILLEAVGDAGLLLSGYWWGQEGADRESVDVDYVMRLGRLAYRCIDREPYRELADKYSPLIDAFTVLASHYAPLVHRDRALLALYQAWEHHRQPRTARILGRLGIPVTVPGRMQS